MLSRRAKEAIKTGLAMAVAFGVALGMGWEKPHWAGFAVAMISLSTAGQSLNKGAMRMLGTLLATVVALALIAVFPQQRWLLILALSLYVGFCTYMLTGKKRQYFWFVSAFVCVIIIVDGGPNSQNAFHVAVERAQETGMGILVYSLIATFLWPQSSRSDLEDASRKLFAVQRQLYRGYRELMGGRGAAEDARPLRMQEVQLVGRVGQALNAAETDSYTVWEVRHQWRRFRDDLAALGGTLERWRETFPEIQELDLATLLPNLDPLCAELDMRFSTVERMLAGEAPSRTPQAVALAIEQDEMRALSHFRQAAVAVTKAQLDRLEELSRSLFDSVRDIKGFGTQAGARRRGATPRQGIAIDPERLIAALRVMATLWVAFLIWVYVDPPGHASFAQLAGTIALAAAMLSMGRPSILLPPFAFGTVVAGVLYVFVMPQLSGYAELGLMIFGVTFVIYYLFWEPRHALAKMGAIVPFVVLISVENHQTYSFSGYANSAAMIMLVISLVTVMAYFPTSPRPEKAFLRLFRRFHRQTDFMLSRLALDRDRRRGWAERWKLALYSSDLQALPRKLELLGQRIDYAVLPNDTPEKVHALVTNLQAVAYRIDELLEARELPHADLLVQQFQDELRAWRQVAQEQLRLWGDDPVQATAQVLDMEGRLAARMARLEARIGEFHRQTEPGSLGAPDYENFFRYLGGLRGLSESGIGFIRIAETVDWARWREARF